MGCLFLFVVIRHCNYKGLQALTAALSYLPPGAQCSRKNWVYKVDKCKEVPSPSLMLCVRLG